MDKVGMHNAIMTSKVAVLLRDKGAKVDPLDYLALVKVALNELPEEHKKLVLEGGRPPLKETREEAWRRLEELASLPLPLEA